MPRLCKIVSNDICVYIKNCLTSVVGSNVAANVVRRQTQWGINLVPWVKALCLGTSVKWPGKTPADAGYAVTEN